MFYKYKNNYYIIINECKIKNHKSGEWVDAFIYSPIIDNKIMNVKYVIEKTDFIKKFKSVKIEFKD